MRRVVLAIMFIPLLGIAQTGPGGIGVTNGTSNLVIWLDANTLSGLSDGAPVSSWADQSGYGNNAVTADDYSCEQAPEYEAAASGRNGYPSVYFDSDNYEILEIAYDAMLAPTQSMSVFGVFQPAADAGNNSKWGGILMFEDNDNWINGYCFGCRYNVAPNWVFYANSSFEGIKPWDNGAGAGTYATNFANGTHYVLGMTRDYTTGDMYYWQNDGAFVARNTLAPNNDAIIYSETNALTICGYTVDPCGGNRYAVEGYLPELIMFNDLLNKAQVIILNNYLAAKYDISLVNNNLYDEDDNGDYDHDVAGIGRVDASNIHNDAQGTGIVRILNPTNLGDNEFLMWGHDNGVLQATETSDVPANVQARFDRTWRVSERNAANISNVNVGKIDMRWDLNGLGFITASDLRLLIDTDNDGSFNDETAISGATDLGGGIFEFTNISGGAAGISNDRRFTIGTINSSQTPLPIELVYFNAIPENNRTVKLEWQTASEKNNDFFTVERSLNGLDWEIVTKVDGTVNSNTILIYSTVDNTPYNGVSYYRLNQTDFNGHFEYSAIKYVNLHTIESNIAEIYPNPTNGQIIIMGDEFELAEIRIFNTLGQDVSAVTTALRNKKTVTIDMSNLSKGMYYIKTKTTANKVYKQ